MSEVAEINVSVNVSMYAVSVEAGEEPEFSGDTNYGQLLKIGWLDHDDFQHYDEEAIPHLIGLGLLPEGWENPDTGKEAVTMHEDQTGHDNLPTDGAYAGAIRYVHPQGASIIVFADGTMDVRAANGKKKRTTATPETLREGHGQWRRVTPGE